MITICTGWTTPHPKPVILKPEDGKAPGTSHGICAQCQRDLGMELPQPTAYQEYLAGPFDPRD